MLNVGSRKNGFTLVEVLVVISIMGILTSMGVASLRRAVINNRVRDYALNTAAFLERVANDANRMSKPLCIKFLPKSIDVYETSDCSGSSLEQFSIDLNLPLKFGCDIDASIQELDGMENDDNWAGSDVVFTPRIGLSPAPKGFVCIQYGANGDDGNAYGLAIKSTGKNMIVPKWIPKWEVGNSWQDL